MTVNALSPTASSAANASSSGTASASSTDASFQSLLAQLQSGASGTAAGAAGVAGSASADPTEDRFLKLLVAQMKNQDPLNPADNAQITSQMAQINTVKGIDSVNTQLRALVARTGTASASEAAAMVGRNVLIEGNALALKAGGTVKAGFVLGGEATAVKIEILDSAGKVVDSQSLGGLPAGLQTLEWDGKIQGDAAPAGTYSLRVTASKAGKDVSVTPLIAAQVLAASRSAQGISLQLGSLGTRLLDDIKGIL